METPAVAARKARLEKTKQILLQLVPTEKYRAISTIAYNVGVSKKVAEEYLQILKDLEVVHIKDGEVTK